MPLATLFQAMALLDPATGQPRGYMRLGARPVMDSLLFSLDLRSGGAWADAERFARVAAPLAVQVRYARW